MLSICFFFQAEDGIRDYKVTGVQTCALPIYLCVIRSMYTDRPNHEPSLFMLNSGEKLPGRPSMGSWVTYGLGTENQNLPGFRSEERRVGKECRSRWSPYH